MSFYQFTPSSDINLNQSYVTWSNGFTEEEIDKIREIGDALTLTPAIIDNGETINNIRTSKVGWIKNEGDSSWLYDRLAYIARRLNSQFFNFDLTGFCEDMQYTIYDGNEEGHYTWHTDLISNSNNSFLPPRKLSMVLQLSDPSEYEGGCFETWTRPEPNQAPKEKGLIVAFPSWTLHRVAPVTSGTRKTLVVWICGKQFV